MISTQPSLSKSAVQRPWASLAKLKFVLLKRPPAFWSSSFPLPDPEESNTTPELLSVAKVSRVVPVWDVGDEVAGQLSSADWATTGLVSCPPLANSTPAPVTPPINNSQPSRCFIQIPYFSARINVRQGNRIRILCRPPSEKFDLRNDNRGLCVTFGLLFRHWCRIPTWVYGKRTAFGSLLTLKSPTPLRAGLFLLEGLRRTPI